MDPSPKIEPGSKREQNRNEQRERILDAARFLFGARSFDDVTMAELAQLAGVSRATVFNYFPSKHALVEAITQEVLAYWVGMLETALADEDTATPALVRALFAHMGAGIEQYYRFYRGVFREMRKMQLGLDEGSASARVREGALERLQRLLARGQQRGELAAEHRPADLTSAFDSLANGTITHWLFEDPSGSLRERMERAAEIFLGAVATQRSTGRPDAVPDLASLPRRPRSRARRRDAGSASRRRRP
jgi:AcrR family transcriptional regulator